MSTKKGNTLLITTGKEPLEGGEVTEAIWKWGHGPVYACLVAMVATRHPALPDLDAIQQACLEAYRTKAP